MADLTLLATLKDKLIHATNFADVSRYFFDHFGDDPEFIKLGEATRHPFLEAVVAQVAGQIFGQAALAAGKDALLNSVLLTRLADHQFIHGGLNVAGHVGTIIYFEDEGVGLVSVAMSMSGDMQFARFRGQRLQRVPKPSDN